MRLFRLDYAHNVVELVVVKETPKTVIFKYPDEFVGSTYPTYTIRKADLDKVKYSFTNITATSVKSLKKLYIDFNKDNVNYFNRRIRILEDNLERAMFKFKMYSKKHED